MKILKFTTLCIAVFALSSCSTSTTGENQKTDSTHTQTHQKVITQCSATKSSEENFADTFITYNKDDIQYADSKNYSKLNVKDIEDIFNNARALDPGVSISEKMTLPPQSIWDIMNPGEKILYLVNSERCARGIRAFEGIDTTLTDNVARPYTQYISTHTEDFKANPHSANGKTLQQRVESSTDLKPGVNMESIFENIATFEISSSVGYENIYESEAKAVYGWLYKDKSQNYGHRKNLLKTGLIDNSGQKGTEGIIGASVITTGYIRDGLYTKKAFIVMDGVDPASNWDNNLENIKKVSLYR